MSARRLSRVAIDVAVDALLGDRDGVLVARPIQWRVSGEALALHRGGLYRLISGLTEPFDHPPLVIGLTLILSKWEVLTVAELLAERVEMQRSGGKPGADAAPRPARKTRKPAATRGKIGRRTAAEVWLDLPEADRAGWLGVKAAAEELEIGRDRIRRAISTGLLPVRSVGSTQFVEREACRRLLVDSSSEPSIVEADPEVYQ